MNTSDWTGAIAAVIDGKGVVRGTAFFVGPDVALTCDHVLASAGVGPISLRQVGSGDTEQVIGEDRDNELDLALVRVRSRADRPQLTLSLDEVVPGSRVYSRGFSREYDPVRYPDGFPMDPARISGETTLIWRGQPVEMLVLVDAAIQKGLSGAPAIDMERNSVVGILRFSEDKGKRALAVPAVVATRRWPGLLTASGQTARSFNELVDTVAEELASTAWQKFDPALLHCVVVGSESLSSGGPGDTLAGLVKEALSSPKATDIWDSFRRARGGRRLVQAAEGRRLAQEYARANVQLSTFDVADAYASSASLDLAVRLIVEADLALFDVTNFEAGVMLLLGIRAASRRGVTINSLGGGWKEGEPTLRPFNLSDLSLSSHTSLDEIVGEDPRIGRLVERVCAGFNQLIRQPSYQDLPVYDALRKLGPQEDAWTSIPLEAEVLMLCSYGKNYYPTWKYLRSQVQGALGGKRHNIRTNVVRLQDLSTPQLVSQSLYERIRRCTSCIADWTDRSPSTFFEIGVRIAASPWGVVQIASEGWLNAAVSPTSGDNHDARQIARMKALLDPLLYTQGDDAEIGERIAGQLVEMRANIAGSSGHRLRQVTAEALRMTEERLPDLFHQLMNDADTLNYQGRMRDHVPQALFYEVTEIKADQERAALERRMAAWFYLEHRLGAGNLDESDERKRLWRELGEIVASDLFLSNDEADQSLALLIAERLSQGILRDVTLQRRQGDALARDGQVDAANQAYEVAISLLDAALEGTTASQAEKDSWSPGSRVIAAADKADMFGIRGGLLRRMGRLADALESYTRGAEIEHDNELPATYNRVNAIKLTLMMGGGTIEGLRDKLQGLRVALEGRLSTDERVADDAWAWADLGDIRLLLGDDLEAASAYQNFAAKARTDSPAATLSVLGELISALEAHGDPDAARIAASLRSVEGLLSPAHPEG